MINFDKNQLLSLFPQIEKENQDLFVRLVGAIADNFDVFVSCEQQHPAIHNNVNYGCISAIAFRSRACTTSKPCSLFPLVQVELMSKNQGCVVIARPEDVKIYKIGKR
ncbi:MAG: hypothetical protein IJ004_06205 [Clostridia bacterium]|nr:hypothetical protein [Clostridia bacterium]